MIDAITDITMKLGEAINDPYVANRFMIKPMRLGVVLHDAKVVDGTVNIFESILGPYTEDLGVVIRKAISKTLTDVTNDIPYMGIEEINFRLSRDVILRNMQELTQLFYTINEFFSFTFNNTHTDMVVKMNPDRVVMNMVMNEWIKPFNHDIPCRFMPIDDAMEALREAFNAH